MVMSDNKELKFAWLPKSDKIGERLFTFGGEEVFNLFRDYPNALTPEQKKSTKSGKNQKSICFTLVKKIFSGYSLTAKKNRSCKVTR